MKEELVWKSGILYHPNRLHEDRVYVFLRSPSGSYKVCRACRRTEGQCREWEVLTVVDRCLWGAEKTAEAVRELLKKMEEAEGFSTSPDSQTRSEWVDAADISASAYPRGRVVKPGDAVVEETISRGSICIGYRTGEGAWRVKLADASAASDKIYTSLTDAAPGDLVSLDFMKGTVMETETPEPEMVAVSPVAPAPFTPPRRSRRRIKLRGGLRG